MTFFENGNFEAIATNTATANSTKNTSDTNPFGLKDFSKLLDNKFGNSAFSDNLLAKPKGISSGDNPFDSDSKWTRPTLGDYMNGGNPYSIKQKPKNAAKAEKKEEKQSNPSIFGKGGMVSEKSVFEGKSINKGTGMAAGGMYLLGRHKLDLCY